MLTTVRKFDTSFYCLLLVSHIFTNQFIKNPSYHTKVVSVMVFNYITLVNFDANDKMPIFGVLLVLIENFCSCNTFASMRCIISLTFYNASYYKTGLIYEIHSWYKTGLIY